MQSPRDASFFDRAVRLSLKIIKQGALQVLLQGASLTIGIESYTLDD